MELRNRETGAVITDGQFRASFPNTSFPRVLTVEILSDFGYDPILEAPQAVTTPPYEISQRAGIEEVNGQWFTKYIVGPVFTDYVDEDGNTVTAAEQEAAYRQRIDEEAAKRVRQDRNNRLGDCDWTQLPDSPLDADAKLAWQLYRETLRMVPEQPGFPHNVEWPEEPTT
jgi:hypothetical protein